jgi:hypothetical protein
MNGNKTVRQANWKTEKYKHVEQCLVDKFSGGGLSAGAKFEKKKVHSEVGRETATSQTKWQPQTM